MASTDATPAPAEGPAPLASGSHEHTALTASARGLPQRLAARQMGISERSYRRYLRRAAGLLGTDSIHLAASLAIARGHITLAHLLDGASVDAPPEGNAVTEPPPSETPTSPGRALSIMVKRWRCPHCIYSKASKNVVEKHIDRCWRNPANRACKTCVHFERAGGEECDCTPSCKGMSWPDSCGLGEKLPDDRPVLHCPVWEPEEVG
jgi:DNA-binding CsgD family transcriptional regulator